MTDTYTITRISTHVLRAPLGADRFYSSQASFPERNSMLVKVEVTPTAGAAAHGEEGEEGEEGSREGGARETLFGWGEGGQYGPGEPVAAVIDDVLGPMLLGRAVRPTRCWEEMYVWTGLPVAVSRCCLSLLSPIAAPGVFRSFLLSFQPSSHPFTFFSSLFSPFFSLLSSPLSFSRPRLGRLRLID